jgi:hypothetical protein
MIIGKTENTSANFIQTDWQKKNQQDEAGFVSSAVKQDKDITKKSVDELSKTLGQKVDKSEENTFSASYGVEISEEGY